MLTLWEAGIGGIQKFRWNLPSFLESTTVTQIIIVAKCIINQLGNLCHVYWCCLNTKPCETCLVLLLKDYTLILYFLNALNSCRFIMRSFQTMTLGKRCWVCLKCLWLQVKSFFFARHRCDIKNLKFQHVDSPEYFVPKFCFGTLQDF